MVARGRGGRDSCSFNICVGEGILEGGDKSCASKHTLESKMIRRSCRPSCLVSLCACISGWCCQVIGEELRAEQMNWGKGEIVEVSEEILLPLVFIPVLSPIVN